MRKISTSPRYVIGITGTDPLCLGELGGGNSEQIRNMRNFNLRRSDRILMKFDVWKYIMSQSSYIKYQPYPVKEMLRGGRNLNSWEKLRVEGSG